MPIAALRPAAGSAILQLLPIGKRPSATIVRGIRGLSPILQPGPLVAPEPPFTISTCGSVTEELYEALRPLAYDDANQDDALWTFCCAISGMIQDIEDLSRDDGDMPGWSKFVNLDDAPTYALDWLGQMVGVRPQGGLTVAQRRSRIFAKEGFNRGSPTAMRSAAQVYLTGTKTVLMYERDTSPYHISVSTYTSETPDVARVLAALQSQKPAGVQLSYSAVPGQTYAQLLANHATYTLVNSFYSNYGEVVNDLP